MWTAKTDQTGRMPRFIWVFAGRTCHFVGFVMRQLIFMLLLRFCFLWYSILTPAKRLNIYTLNCSVDQQDLTIIPNDLKSFPTTNVFSKIFRICKTLLLLKYLPILTKSTSSNSSDFNELTNRLSVHSKALPRIYLQKLTLSTSSHSPDCSDLTNRLSIHSKAPPPVPGLAAVNLSISTVSLCLILPIVLTFSERKKTTSYR